VVGVARPGRAVKVPPIPRICADMGGCFRLARGASCYVEAPIVGGRRCLRPSVGGPRWNCMWLGPFPWRLRVCGRSLSRGIPAPRRGAGSACGDGCADP
jgi:hypothetical protein